MANAFVNNMKINKSVFVLVFGLSSLCLGASVPPPDHVTCSTTEVSEPLNKLPTLEKTLIIHGENELEKSRIALLEPAYIEVFENAGIAELRQAELSLFPGGMTLATLSRSYGSVFDRAQKLHPEKTASWVRSYFKAIASAEDIVAKSLGLDGRKIIKTTNAHFGGALVVYDKRRPQTPPVGVIFSSRLCLTDGQMSSSYPGFSAESCKSGKMTEVVSVFDLNFEPQTGNLKMKERSASMVLYENGEVVRRSSGAHMAALGER